MSKMDIKEQKMQEKADRKYFLSATPIIRPDRDIKHFNNAVDATKYLTKHWNNIAHNEFSVYGSGNVIYGYRHIEGEDDDVEYMELHIKHDTHLEQAISLVNNHYFDGDYDLVSSIWINRLERTKAFNERQNLIQMFQDMNTKQLLNCRRCGGPGGFFIDDWTRQVLKAVLDSREHIPTSEDRRNMRLAKAKLQKTY
jgi:hypothetical protein